MKKILLCLTSAIALCVATPALAQSDQSVARQWNEEVLYAISADFARPTVHARNLVNLEGTEQNPAAYPSVFEVDTKSPEVQQVNVSDFVINDNVAAGGELSITLTFSEPCVQNEDVEITILSDQEIGNSLMLNSSESAWIDNQTYIVYFSLTDEDAFSEEIHLSVEMVEDLFGNQMGVSLNENVLILDTKNPELNDISVNDNVLNIQDFGNTNLIVTVEFDEPMNDESTPELVFNNQNPLGISLVYNEVASNWTSENTCEIHYLFESTEAEFIDVEVSLENFQDSNGNSLNDSTVPELFSIDTKRPLVELVTPEDIMVSDQNVENGGFSIDVVFSETMDEEQPALVLLTAPEIENSLTNNFISSNWIDENTFRADFDASDENVEIDNVGLTVGFALDANGNAQNEYIQDAAFDLDTRNPELISLSSSDYLIEQDDIGEESFNMVMIFDESMDAEAEINVSFSPEAPVNSIIQLNPNSSEWINQFTYLAVFDVFESSEVISSVSVLASEGGDLAGNPMQSSSFENLLSIDMSVLSTNSITDIEGVEVYPTLLTNGDVLTITLPQNPSTGSFRIRDVKGRILQEQNLTEFSSGKNRLTIDDFSSGMYLYELYLDGDMATGKLIIR